jgi:MoaA/NifB/PqqE/SkfB family radical SAM enzyme
VYKQVTWDISGVCNAQCLYCPSGGRNVLGNLHKSQSGFLSPKNFEDGLHFMIDKGIISPDETEIGLFNWGEPFLHPQFETMLRIVANMGFAFCLSSNGATYKMIPEDTLWRLKSLAFSTPGFSQSSYDRMHGFDVGVIRKNIEAIISPIRRLSPGTSIGIILLLYKWNLADVNTTLQFCFENGVNISFVCSHFTGITMPLRQYSEEDFLVDQWDTIKQHRPDNWDCPQYSGLVLDEFSNVLQCCVTDRYSYGNIIGKLKEVDFGNLEELRRSASVCRECKKCKIDYLTHNPSQDIGNIVHNIIFGGTL